MGNVIFIHVGNLIVDKKGVPNKNRCQNILNEIKKYIMESKIYEDVDEINVELIGDPNITFDVPKAKITHNGNNTRQWEFPTLYKIIDYAKHNPKSNILYLHTKGSSNNINVPEIKWIEDVRNYHLYWNVSRYKDSLKYLEEFDACGAELIGNPVRHFSQNFWWARASHINKLPDPKTYPIVLDERHQCEFWIGLNDSSMYKSVNNLYDDYVNAINFDKSLYRNE